MKKLFVILFGFLGLVVMAVIVLGGVLFFRPNTLINEKNLNLALEKSGLLKRYSWSTGEIGLEWVKWNKRRFVANFEDFCVLYEKDGLRAQTCLEEVSWSLLLQLSTNGGFSVVTEEPVFIDSRLLTIDLPPESARPVKQAQETEGDPPDIKKMWDLFWSDIVPDFIVNFDEILINSAGGSSFDFDFNVKKIKEKLDATSMGIKVVATPENIQIDTPKNFKLPFEAPYIGPIVINRFKFKATVKEDGIPIRVDALAYGVSLLVTSELELPIADSFTSPKFLKRIAKNTKAKARVDKVKSKVEAFMKHPISTLPAPLNALDGTITLDAFVKDGLQAHEIEINAKVVSDLTGKKQELDFDVLAKVLMDLETKKPGAMFFDLDVKKIIVQAPRLPKKALPPQFMPDARIHTEEMAFNKEIAQKHTEEPPPVINMRIKAHGQNYVGLRTNLLEEMVRFNMDLMVERGKLRGGYVKVLPFDTEFFKRDIKFKKFFVDFADPEEPVVNGEIMFDLPEYDVTVFLEGPLSKPRHYLQSDPPLPEEDIYAVLLFGRPMVDLEGGDKDAAQRTNDVLAQGLLSVGVLYFLSDTPVQAIIYDPDSEQLSAQFALGEKRSLTVGQDSVGVRQSLGGGWYVDTSTKTDQGGYGVMLERINAY